MAKDPVVLPHSFCTFLYPFHFRSEDFEIIAASLKKDSFKGRPVWMPHTFQNEDLLPHVADFLNCPADEGALAQKATVLSWDLQGEALGHHEFLGARCAWTCVHGKGERRLTLVFEVTEVNLTLFRIGIGFLHVQVRPETVAPEVWQDFIHLFRFLEGSRSPVLQARRRVGKDQWEPCRPGLLPRGVPGADEPDTFHMAEIVNTLLKRYLLVGSGSQAEISARLRSVYIKSQMIPYVGLFINGYVEEHRMRLLNSMKNFFESKQVLDPAPNDISPLNPDYLQYTSSSWFVFSLDGACFLAFDAPDTSFFKENLPHHLARDQYYLLFLLVQHQRLVLMGLSNEVAAYWGEQDPARRESLFDDLRDRLLFFTSNGYFHQVMQREHHHRVYRMWQEKLQVHQLYSEVAGEVRDIHERSLLKVQERTQKHADRLNNILFLLAPVSIALGLAQTIGSFIAAPVPAPHPALHLALQVGLGSVLVGFGLGLGIVMISLFFKRRSRK